MGKRNLRHTQEKITSLHNNLEQLWLNCELHRLDVRHQEVLLNRAAYVSWESSLKRGCHGERRKTPSELLSIVAVDLKVAFLRNWNCLWSRFRIKGGARWWKWFQNLVDVVVFIYLFSPGQTVNCGFCKSPKRFSQRLSFTSKVN